MRECPQARCTITVAMYAPELDVLDRHHGVIPRALTARVDAGGLRGWITPTYFSVPSASLRTNVTSSKQSGTFDSMRPIERVARASDRADTRTFSQMFCSQSMQCRVASCISSSPSSVQQISHVLQLAAAILAGGGSEVRASSSRICSSAKFLVTVRRLWSNGQSTCHSTAHAEAAIISIIEIHLRVTCP